MSLEKGLVKQCCTTTPVWIFIYSDGRIFAICNDDFKSPSHRIGVQKIINIKSRESFTPEKLFGDVL